MNIRMGFRGKDKEPSAGQDLVKPGADDYRASARDAMEKEVGNILSDEIKKAAQELIEEQRKVIQEVLEEHRAIIRQTIEEEKAAMRAKIEETRRSILELGATST